MPVAHPVVRGVLTHSGQTLALLAVGVLAAGAGPVRREPGADIAAPAAAPVVAVAEPAGPLTASLICRVP